MRRWVILGLTGGLTVALAGSLWAAPGMVDVPVLREPVARGQVLTAAHLTSLAVPTNQVFASTVTTADEAVGQVTVRPLLAGVPLNRLQLRVPPAIARGSTVTFVFARGGVELTGQGQALEDGAVGGSIKIANPATRTTLVGTVQPNQTVTIN